MRYRTLGGTDFAVSELCFGPMRSATKGEPTADARSRAGEDALRAALDRGINFLHSSYEYGTRWMMGRVLKDHPKRHDVHHVIKVPVPDFKDGGRFDAAKFALRIDEALTELHADRIAVLQWMWRDDPNDDAHRLPMLPAILDDVVAAFGKMRDAGKVGHLMTFPYTPDCARAAIDSEAFSGIIAYYNAIEMEMAPLFPEMERRGMGFLCIRPLYEGILTDRRTDQASLPDGDRFRDASYTADFAKRAKIADAFRDEIGSSMTSFAVRLALGHPLVASIIVGLNSPDQVDGMVRALEGKPLSKEVVARAQALWARNFDLA